MAYNMRKSSSRYVILHVPTAFSSFSWSENPSNSNRMFLNLTFHVLDDRLSHVADSVPLKIPFPRETILRYSSFSKSIFCATSPTNGPNLPAEDPSFVVNNNFHSPSRTDELVNLRVGFAISSSLTISAICSLFSLDACTPFCVPFAALRMESFKLSTSILEDDGAKKDENKLLNENGEEALVAGALRSIDVDWVRRRRMLVGSDSVITLLPRCLPPVLHVVGTSLFLESEPVGNVATTDSR
mmetsp:Transcript_8378/g.11522  ORF Transcript_8378/g.11522 Transcript_8378/m.11522 type:complete len:242 (+) Transcript_8378:147-872(+)